MIEQIESRECRYEMRNAIESIIKEQKIDRSIFHETGKWNYEKVIRKIYYSFCNYKKYPNIQINYMWTRLRDDLKSSELIYTDWKNWDSYIEQMKLIIPEKNPSLFYYLLTDGGWVYEGTLKGMEQMLKEYPAWMYDFYLTPKDISWLIVHCEDGACMSRIWN